ncbi:MAG: hypothetical protein AABZ84_04905 [Pseudomonadota bacterium]
MLFVVLRAWSGIGIVLLTVGVVKAADPPSVVVTLSAQKIIVSVEGRERRLPAERTRPGDIVEYRAMYKNAGKSTVKNLVATLPVPAAGMEYLPRTADPHIVQASVDGIAFDNVPLKRRIVLPGGRQVSHDIPYSEYRYLRWELGELPPGKNTSVSARMRVNPVEPPPVTLSTSGDKP